MESLCGVKKIICSEKCETLAHIQENIIQREEEGFWDSSETNFSLQKFTQCHI